MAVRDQVAPLDCVVRGRGTFPSRGLSTLDLNYKRISRESGRRVCHFCRQGRQKPAWCASGMKSPAGNRRPVAQDEVVEVLRATSQAPWPGWGVGTLP